MSETEQGDSAGLNAALTALSKYDFGSSRGLLLSIDEAVVRAGCNTTGSKGLETKLVTSLEQQLSEPAREYVCTKLSLVGSEQSLKALTKVAGSSGVAATAARSALEQIPGKKATKALVGLIPVTSGAGKVGVLNSLAARRDPSSVQALARILKDSDRNVVNAALNAIGQIGTSEAAKALLKYQSAEKSQTEVAFGEAVLICAERLLASGNRSAARELYGTAMVEQLPQSVRQAAERGMRACG